MDPHEENLVYIAATIVLYKTLKVDPGGPVVIVLATGSEVRGFKPDRGRWIFFRG